MGKVKNITPEEREQAIYTIGKLGEEITDERIEYYVQLRRNTIEHQEEKIVKEEVKNVLEHDKEFARKVLTYMRRSKSDRQILLYSRKHTETLQYIKENGLDIDYTPSVFGEAVFLMEKQKMTTIHHLTAEDLANCLKDKNEELINNRNRTEEKKKEWQSNSKNGKNEDVLEKTIRLAKIAFWLGVVLVVSPFFITGFGFGWFWYLVIIGIAFFCLLLFGTDGRSKDDYSFVKSILVGFCVVGLVMYLWGPLNPNYVSGGYSSESISELKQKVKERGEISESEAKILVVHYILNHMKDPNSYEPVSWGPLKKTQEIDGEGGGWNIEHRFRGTNSYGAVVTEKNIYLIHKDGWVTSM